MPNIIRTNTLFSKLKILDPRRSIEIEAYSCKQTKHQRSHYKMPKPLRFYVSTLELSLPDYDFSNASLSLFQNTSLDKIRSELSFILFTIYKNQEDVDELLSFFDRVLSQSVSLRNSLFYEVDFAALNEELSLKVFMIHDRKMRRIIVLKMSEEM